MGFEIALAIVGCLIAIVGAYALVVSVWLMVKYVRFNRLENSAGLTGQEVARKILDANGLNHIGVKVTGSFIFGNSYSHYFKKVRLRRVYMQAVKNWWQWTFRVRILCLRLLRRKALPGIT